MELLREALARIDEATKRPSVALRLAMESVPKDLKPKFVDGPPVIINFPAGLKLTAVNKIVKALKDAGWRLEVKSQKGPKNLQKFWRFSIVHQNKLRTAMLSWDGSVFHLRKGKKGKEEYFETTSTRLS